MKAVNHYIVIEAIKEKTTLSGLELSETLDTDNRYNKAKIIDELNKNVNIPIINEDTEEKVIAAIYNVFEDVMGKVLSK